MYSSYEKLFTTILYREVKGILPHQGLQNMLVRSEVFFCKFNFLISRKVFTILSKVWKFTYFFPNFTGAGGYFTLSSQGTLSRLTTRWYGVGWICWSKAGKTVQLYLIWFVIPAGPNPPTLTKINFKSDKDGLTRGWWVRFLKGCDRQFQFNSILQFWFYSSAVF